ncbi:hypothetical protein C7212DRAFT_178104 [Tuber magnatum]|uniref:Fungal-type protein kinase domain-containing protein n=1 Tax=Tuber magnatum TaxID=42249 RepID=A0A317STN9_9PEZI|nr:hypothetical protein C7212DRAFT_178104 [Tuber magnatum]
MPLPNIISRVFELAAQDGERDESKFYGLYNVLLTYLFSFEEEYIVVPQYKRPTQLTSVDFTTIFLVRYKHHPVFFVEVKSSGSLHHISSRREADLQMRERFERLFEDVEIETLYGVSTMGTKICIYQLDRASRRLDLDAIEGDARFVTDTAPAHRWNVDIMTPEGEEKLQEVVRDIKAMSGGL